MLARPFDRQYTAPEGSLWPAGFGPNAAWGAIVCALSLLIGVAIVESPFGAVEGAAAIVVGFVGARLIGVRLLVLVIGLLAIPPGVVGENSFYISVLAFGAVFVATSSVPSVRSLQPFESLLVAAMASIGVGFVWLAHETARRSALAIALEFLLAAGCTRELLRRPALAQRAMRVVAYVISFECACYLVALALNFPGGHEVALKYREFVFYPPFAITSATGGYWPSLPRFAVLGGEPGLGAVMLFASVATVLILERGRRRLALLFLLGLGVAFTQSTGAVLAMAVFGLAFGAARLARRYTLVSAMLFVALTVPFLERLARSSVHAKIDSNSVSVTDRGLASGAAFNGDISLNALYHGHRYLAVLVLVLLAALLLRSVRLPAAAGFLAAIVLTAWYAQPLHEHAGVWLFACLVPLIAECQAASGAAVGVRHAAEV